jgi:hypothetical protein
VHWQRESNDFKNRRGLPVGSYKNRHVAPGAHDEVEPMGMATINDE